MKQAKELAAAALALLDEKEIPYLNGGSTLLGMDCQGCVKHCARTVGVTLNYGGSNDMFRNACSWLGTLAEAKSQNKLVPGAIGFILEQNGQESDKYKGDGIGNASHVGILTLSKDAFSVDASSSAGKVRSRTERDAAHVWTHIGWLKDFDYESDVAINQKRIHHSKLIQPDSQDSAPVIDTEVEEIQAEAVPATIRMAVVSTPDGGSLNMRRAPTTMVDNRIGHVPNGGSVEILDARADGWAKIKFKGISAWVQARYLQLL